MKPTNNIEPYWEVVKGSFNKIIWSLGVAFNGYPYEVKQRVSKEDWDEHKGELVEQVYCVVHFEPEEYNELDWTEEDLEEK